MLSKFVDAFHWVCGMVRRAFMKLIGTETVTVTQDADGPVIEIHETPTWPRRALGVIGACVLFIPVFRVGVLSACLTIGICLAIVAFVGVMFVAANWLVDGVASYRAA